jgi:hypothetical protein
MIYQLKFLIHLISNINEVKDLNNQETHRVFFMFNHNLGVVHRLDRRIEENFKPKKGFTCLI